MSKRHRLVFRVVVLVAVTALAVAMIVTSQANPPVMYFVGGFPPPMAEEIEEVVRVAAADYGLHPLAWWRTTDPVGGTWHTFSLDLLRHGRASGPIPMSAYGSGSQISLSFYEKEGLDAAQLEALAKAVVDSLEDELHLRLCRYDAIKKRCVRPARPRLRYEMVFDKVVEDPGKVVLHDVARRHGARASFIREWNMEKATDEKGMFERFLYADRRSLYGGEIPVLLTNAPSGDRLVLSVFDRGMPPDDIDALARDAKGALERRYGGRFCRADPDTGACDAEHRELEELRERWLDARAAGTAGAVEEFLAAHPAGPHAEAARWRLARVRAMAAPPPPAPPPRSARWTERNAGETFADTLDDGSRGPGMTVVPAGVFNSGCAPGAGCRLEESPVHPVRVARPFALSTREATHAEYFRFARPGKRIEQWWADRPVTHVTWAAAAYAAWLSERTGHRYRLPSEAEWEWAARAGTETAYPWGNEADGRHALCAGCGHSWPPAEWVAPTGSHPPNPWGLFDMHGNAAEWTMDCWRPDHLGAPADGSARTDGDCSRRVVRGGSYETPPRAIRSAARAGRQAGERYLDVGFRVLRELRDAEARAE